MFFCSHSVCAAQISCGLSPVRADVAELNSEDIQDLYSGYHTACSQHHSTLREQFSRGTPFPARSCRILHFRNVFNVVGSLCCALTVEVSSFIDFFSFRASAQPNLTLPTLLLLVMVFASPPPRLLLQFTLSSLSYHYPFHVVGRMYREDITRLVHTPPPLAAYPTSSELSSLPGSPPPRPGSSTGGDVCLCYFLSVSFLHHDDFLSTSPSK